MWAFEQLGRQPACLYGVLTRWPGFAYSQHASQEGERRV